MLTLRRRPSFSSDPTPRRRAGREHWIPSVPGDGDLRPRCYPQGQPALSDDVTRREKDESAR